MCQHVYTRYTCGHADVSQQQCALVASPFATLFCENYQTIRTTRFEPCGGFVCKDTKIGQLTLRGPEIQLELRSRLADIRDELSKLEVEGKKATFLVNHGSVLQEAAHQRRLAELSSQHNTHGKAANSILLRLSVLDREMNQLPPALKRPNSQTGICSSRSKGSQSPQKLGPGEEIIPVATDSWNDKTHAALHSSKKSSSSASKQAVTNTALIARDPWNNAAANLLRKQNSEQSLRRPYTTNPLPQSAMLQRSLSGNMQKTPAFWNQTFPTSSNPAPNTTFMVDPRTMYSTQQNVLTPTPIQPGSFSLLRTPGREPKLPTSKPYKVRSGMPPPPPEPARRSTRLSAKKQVTYEEPTSPSSSSSQVSSPSKSTIFDESPLKNPGGKRPTATGPDITSSRGKMKRRRVLEDSDDDGGEDEYKGGIEDDGSDKESILSNIEVASPPSASLSPTKSHQTPFTGPARMNHTATAGVDTHKSHAAQTDYNSAIERKQQEIHRLEQANAPTITNANSREWGQGIAHTTLTVAQMNAIIAHKRNEVQKMKTFNEGLGSTSNSSLYRLDTTSNMVSNSATAAPIMMRGGVDDLTVDEHGFAYDKYNGAFTRSAAPTFQTPAMSFGQRGVQAHTTPQHAPAHPITQVAPQESTSQSSSIEPLTAQVDPSNDLFGPQKGSNRENNADASVDQMLEHISSNSFLMEETGEGHIVRVGSLADHSMEANATDTSSMQDGAQDDITIGTTTTETGPRVAFDSAAKIDAPGESRESKNGMLDPDFDFSDFINEDTLDSAGLAD